MTIPTPTRELAAARHLEHHAQRRVEPAREGLRLPLVRVEVAGAEARRQPWARMVEDYAVARQVLAGSRRVEELRRAGHELGDTDAGWNALAAAADVERAVFEFEATLG